MLSSMYAGNEHQPCGMLSGEFSPQIDPLVCAWAVPRLHRPTPDCVWGRDRRKARSAPVPTFVLDELSVQ
jgi:hypothetical protein